MAPEGVWAKRRKTAAILAGPEVLSMSQLYVIAPSANDPEALGVQLWAACVDLTVAWVNAIRLGDVNGAARAEGELRFFALDYASRSINVVGVSIGRKAILRSLYAEHGGPDTLLVRTMIDAAITRDAAATGR